MSTSSGHSGHASVDATREGERVVLHIDLDCFFAQVEELNDPSLVGLPVAVSWGDGTSGTFS